MRHANQTPFPAHLLQPAQQKLSEPAPLFDLAEDRLDHPLAFGVGLPSVRGSQLTGHPLFGRQILGYGAVRITQRFLMMFQSFRRDIGINLLALQMGNILFAVIARIRIHGLDLLFHA